MANQDLDEVLLIKLKLEPVMSHSKNKTFFGSFTFAYLTNEIKMFRNTNHYQHK